MGRSQVDDAQRRVQAIQSDDLASQRLRVRVDELSGELERSEATRRDHELALNRERARIEALQEERAQTAAHAAHQLQSLQLRLSEAHSLRERAERDHEAGTAGISVGVLARARAR